MVADVTNGASLPSNFPLANAFPFQIPSRSLPTYIIVTNFLYPSGATTSRTLIPLGPTEQAVNVAAQRYATTTGFTVLFVAGIDLTFFFRNRLILLITVPIGSVLICGIICAVTIGM